MSLARNVGKIVGKGMKVPYQSVDNVLDKAYTKVGQATYKAGMKTMGTASRVANNKTVVNGTKKFSGAIGSIGKVPKYTFQKADQLVDKGLDMVEAGGSKAVNSSIGKKLKIKERSKPIVDKLDKDGNPIKSWDNLYTGKKVNPLYGAAGAGAIIAATAAQYEMGTTMSPITSSKKNVEPGGPPEIMLYDGVGQQSTPNHLNANGNLVFGLHNQRKG